MSNQTERSLHIQMIPAPLWQRNLRAVLGRNSDWRRLREVLLERQGLKCSLCAKEVAESRQLSAHEEWVFMERIEPAVAWLWRVSLVCFHCHAVEHPGVLNALISEGRLSERARIETIEHFCRVNGETKRQWNAQLRAAYREFERQSLREWYVDYGPFAEWMVTRFEADPLNQCDWPEHLEKKWGAERPLPSMASIVASFPVNHNRALPASPHGFLAKVLEDDATAKAMKRRRALLRRKREKLKAAKGATQQSS